MVSEDLNTSSATSASEWVVSKFFKSIPKTLKWATAFLVGGALLGPLFL